MVQYDEDVKQPLRAGNRSDSDEKTGDLDLEASSLSTSTKTASGEKVTVKDPQRNKRNFMTSWAIALCTLLAIQCYNRSYSHSHPHGHGTRAAIDGYMRALSYHHHRDHGKHGKHRGHPGMTPDKAEELFLSIPSNESALAASRSYTGFAHIAGRAGDFRTANIVKNQWEHLLGLPKTKDTEKIYDAGSKQSRRLMTGAPSHHGPAGGPRVWIDTYYVLLNHPAPLNATSTTLYLKDGQGNLVHQAKLKEDALEEDPTSKHGNADVPPFHGYSKAGTATGKLVYAHFGMVEDFEKLKEAGVDMNGKIAMVRYGGNFRGLKVKAAQDAGAAGVIIYSDPGDDGEATEEHGFAAYPDGPARQPSSLQRGSVQYLSQFPGDPNTPGYPSYKDSKRVEPTNLPGIPSLPLSYEDAIPLLTALNGRGPCFEDWAGGLGYKGVKYCSGESEGDLTMTNDVVEKVLPIWNTYAVIPGHISDEVVVIGNHRDGWVFGAADPNSGTASVHEIVKAYGQMAKKGWKPLRTMVIASWDAEEYGLVGSTEMAEDYAQWIQKNVVAYLNVDVAAAGSGYYVRASPTLADLFVQVSEIAAPPEHPTNQTLKIGSLGSGSDYTAFLQHLGVASSDLGYTRTSKDPVYHYHSIYDSEYWMEKYGDPGFHRHVKLAKSLGLAALRLADSPILPLNTTRYSEELYNYLASLKDTAAAHNVTSLDFDQLSTSVGKMYNATGKLDVEISHVQKELAGLSETACGKKRGKKAAHLMKRIRSINKRKASFERGFISKEGLPKRPWYKHLAVAPGLNLGYGSTTYPGVTEAITIFKDEEMAKNELDRVSKAIRKSAYSLAGGDRKKDKKKKKHKH